MSDPITAVVLVVVLFLSDHSAVSRIVVEPTYTDCQVDAVEISTKLVGKPFDGDISTGAQIEKGTMVLDVKTSCLTFFKDDNA